MNAIKNMIFNNNVKCTIFEKISEIIQNIMEYIISMIKYIFERFITIYNVIMLVINSLMIYTFSLNITTLIYIDSLFHILNLVRNIINEKLSDKQVLIKNQILYKTDSLNRYVYYATINIFDNFLSYFIFNKNITIVKHILGLSIMPVIFNDYIYPHYENAFDYITHKSQMLTKRVFSEQIASLIIKLNKVYILDVNLIDKTTLVENLMSATHIYEQTYNFVKNTILTILLIKLRGKSTLYYKLTKYAYIYNSGDYLQNVTIDEAKKIYTRTMITKNFQEMSKPMFIQAMIYLYLSQNPNNNMDLFFIYIQYKFVVFLGMWTILSFVPTTYTKIIVAIISLLFINFASLNP